jgi:hypothetical protein
MCKAYIYFEAYTPFPIQIIIIKETTQHKIIILIIIKLMNECKLDKLT